MASMLLELMEVRHFRNLASMTLELSPGLNVFYGDNAQGKTNLLEAIHLITALRSFRAARNRELVQWHASEACIRGLLQTVAGQRSVEVMVSDGGRRAMCDGKPIPTTSDFAQLVKVVLFLPEDLLLVRGHPSVRRQYIDHIIFHLYPRYSQILKEYSSIVSHKNRLLSVGITSGHQFEVWQERQVELGSRVIVTRARFVRRILSTFESCFREISGTSLPTEIRYKSGLRELDSGDGNELRVRFRHVLSQFAQEERQRGMCLVGPHRDDLEVLIEGRSAATYGSQGQLRMLALCLKIVELRVLLELQGAIPIFLLDDVSSELDGQRNQFLMQYLAQVGCQVFLTTTALDHVAMDAFKRVSTFQVANGLAQLVPLLSQRAD